MTQGAADPANNQGLVDGASPAEVGTDVAGEPAEKDRFQRRIDQLTAQREAAKEDYAGARNELAGLREEVSRMRSDQSEAKAKDSGTRTMADMSVDELETLYVNAGQQSKVDGFGNPIPLSQEERARYDKYRLQAMQELSKRNAKTEANAVRDETERRATSAVEKDRVARQIFEDFGADSADPNSELTLTAAREFAKYKQKYGDDLGDRFPEYIHMSFGAARKLLNGGVSAESQVNTLERSNRRIQMENSLGASTVGTPDAGGPSVRQHLNKGTKQGRKAAVRNVMDRILANHSGG